MSWNSKDYVHEQVTQDADYSGYYKYIITDLNYNLGGTTKNQKVYVGANNFVGYGVEETIITSDYIRCYYDYWSSSGMYTKQAYISYGNETSEPYSKYFVAAYYDSTGSSSVYPYRNVWNGGIFYIRYTSDSKKTEVENMLRNYGATFECQLIYDITSITNYSSLTPGQHTLGVKATDSTGTYDDSSMSAVTFTKLAVPGNESISGSDYTFGQVQGADKYYIYADNTLLGTVEGYNIVQNGDELQINSAPAQQNGSEVTII